MYDYVHGFSTSIWCDSLSFSSFGWWYKQMACAPDSGKEERHVCQKTIRANLVVRTSNWAFRGSRCRVGCIYLHLSSANSHSPVYLILSWPLDQISDRTSHYPLSPNVSIASNWILQLVSSSLLKFSYSLPPRVIINFRVQEAFMIHSGDFIRRKYRTATMRLRSEWVKSHGPIDTHSGP